MIQSRRPNDDEQRVEALHALNMLDTPREERYDRLIKRLAKLLEVPIAYLALIFYFQSRGGYKPIELVQESDSGPPPEGSESA